MAKAVGVKKMIKRVNAIYASKGYHSPRRYDDIALMVSSAKELGVPPERFFDFVEWLAEGKSFQEARDLVMEQE